MLTINNLEVNYGKEIALSIKSKITFEEGNRIGIIGANGAGKTTLVKAILGLVKYNGSIHTNLLPEQMSAHMQENNYVVTMKIKYIIEAILGCSIKNNEKLKELINFFNFEGCLNKKYSNLSGGQKQRLTIILVLIQDSPLVFFDEVTSGLDFETRNQLMEKISEWYKNKNSTVCIVSHYYEELERLANKILILDKGKVVDFGVKEELFEKYCGNSVIIIQNDTIEDNLTKKFTRIEAPENLIAISCESKENELEIINILASNNINFKRSNNDIEIMVMNAKASQNKLNHYKKL
ncbi:ATP-binding cassette domain-containing protein [Clostridium gasigenes]|uniref:ABC transporter ATP-binding protein n=1 Tax=Clostridium gasigenes TaxID=94869 RepID=A0A7X0SBY3_9CLOT|nr:ABC transporter ATP-binding protein [Clostridium gasigenes]MBB6713573.1 ABC transporter ATP-binding protein [Clostridium gasigenes]